MQSKGTATHQSQDSFKAAEDPKHVPVPNPTKRSMATAEIMKMANH